MQETIPERPQGVPTQAPGQQSGELPTATPEESIAAALVPGEQVATFGSVLRMVGPQRFEDDHIALTTHRRLIIVGPAEWGSQVKEIHDLDACVVLNGKERPDGSRLLALQHGSGRILLAFSVAESRTADALLAAIGVPAPTTPPAAVGLPPAPTPPAQPAAAASPQPETAPPTPPPMITGPRDDIDTFALTQFLHDLTEADINGRDEDE